MQPVCLLLRSGRVGDVRHVYRRRREQVRGGEKHDQEEQQEEHEDHHEQDEQKGRLWVDQQLQVGRVVDM